MVMQLHYLYKDLDRPLHLAGCGAKLVRGSLTTAPSLIWQINHFRYESISVTICRLRAVAQLVEQRSPKPQVAGSSPVCPASSATFVALKVTPALTERREMSEELEQQSEDLVEKSRANRAQARGPIGRMILFLQQVLAELRKVNRPTYAELRNYTGVVLGFVVVVMAIIFGLDFIFGQGVIWLYTAFSPAK